MRKRIPVSKKVVITQRQEVECKFIENDQLEERKIEKRLSAVEYFRRRYKVYDRRKVNKTVSRILTDHGLPDTDEEHEKFWKKMENAVQAKKVAKLKRNQTPSRNEVYCDLEAVTMRALSNGDGEALGF